MSHEPQSNQFIILHLSDVHFGDGHTFSPDTTTSGEQAAERVPDLLESITADLSGMEQHFDSVLLMVSGDLTVQGADGEFTLVRNFLEGLNKQTVLGAHIGLDNTFIVPGNHDVRYTEEGHEAFWKGFYNFYRDYYGNTDGRDLERPDAERFSRVHDLSDSMGLIVVELATCHHNHKGTVDLQRGFIDQQDLIRIEERLKAIDKERANKAVKIAMLHHHPVLIPAFAEPGRNYDAVVNSGLLLNLLNDFGFQLVLHGHKHNPHSFIYDTTCGWHRNNSTPMLIVAGGSASSNSFLDGGGNAYNLINIRHNFKTNETRVQVTTRGLFRLDEHNRPMLRHKWYWDTIKLTDRVLTANPGWTYGNVDRREFDESDKDHERLRDAEYARLRQNMPIVEVVPSLKPDQEFEARMKIVGHKFRNELPQKVVWSAGKRFSVSTCLREMDESFPNTYSFFGPMLIQVSMTFDDGKEEHTYIYAHERR